MTEQLHDETKPVRVGKWLLVVGVALFFIPGILTAFFGFYLGPAITSGLDILSYVSVPLILVGAILLFRNRKKKLNSAEAVSVPAALPGGTRSRGSLVGWNILAVLLSLPVTFAIIFAGGMAGDQGTPSAYIGSYVIMGFGVLYFVSTIFCVLMSQKWRSLKWTLWPMVVPGILILISVLSPLILTPLLYFSGLR